MLHAQTHCCRGLLAAVLALVCIAFASSAGVSRFAPGWCS